MAPTARTRDVEPVDTGTPQLHRHRAVRLELTGRGHAVRARVTDGSALDWLRTRDMIDAEQHAAGERLARQMHAARMLGCPTARLVRESRSSGVTTSAAEAFAAVGLALGELAADQRSAVLALLIDDARPDHAGLALIRAALDRLGAGRTARCAPVLALW
jgi:hypothetical protein